MSTKLKGPEGRGKVAGRTPFGRRMNQEDFQNRIVLR